MDAGRIPGKLDPLFLTIYFLMSHSFPFPIFFHFQNLLNSLPEEY